MKSYLLMHYLACLQTITGLHVCKLYYLLPCTVKAKAEDFLHCRAQFKNCRQNITLCQLHKYTWFFVTLVTNFENSLCDTDFPPPFKPQCINGFSFIFWQEIS